MKSCHASVAILSGLFAVPVAAQVSWPEGKTAAIVLTYDDGLHSQLDIAIPQLDAAQLKGTFFLDGDVTAADKLRWRKVQQAGHELGNHSYFHPCPRALLPDRPQYDTDKYDVTRMLGEITSMNDVLASIDGLKSRTYSVPCSQMLVGGVDYTNALRLSGLVKYARTGGDEFRSVVGDSKGLDRFQVPSWGPVDHPDGPHLVAYVMRVQEAHGLGVLQFHGVGGDYLEVSERAHRELIEYLDRHHEIWVDTFQNVMDYVVTHSR
jgi:peptidoglycan/xylan/chitin deacetylase (PgdA/CDA1 family)